MKDNEAFEILGKRVAELTELPEVKEQMVQIAKEKGIPEAEKWVYLLAIESLLGD